ncbi:MAG: hypothetical protein ACXW3N_10730 [Rhodoplanes sp.]
MIGALRTVLRYGFELIERPFERLFGAALNPLAQLGALGFFFLLDHRRQRHLPLHLLRHRHRASL